ncbi:3'5'-cyclic nucleotide phosphodiesterase, partial [Kipferlia bialata]
AAHDIEHTGVSSDLLTNVRHPLYHLFGSTSTFEKFHCMLGLFTLRYYSVFDTMPSNESNYCQALFETLVLATDPKSVFSSMDEMAALRVEQGATTSELQASLLTSIIRMADISNASRPFVVARTHSLNVMREFFKTGDIEFLSTRSL